MGDAAMTLRKNLTDRYVQSLKRAANGKPYEVMDETVRQLGVRVMGTAERPVRTFILVARFTSDKSPTRRALGAYVKPPELAPEQELTVDQLLLLDALTLAEARAKANEWLRLIGRGIDPAREADRLRNAETRRQNVTFKAVFDDFAEQKLATERKGVEVKRDITNNFLAAWKDRPITDITDLDVLGIINAKKKDAPSHARNLLGDIKRFFDWAIEQRVYGVTVNPCATLKPKKIIGKKKRGQRTLTDDELFALWRAVQRLPYPFRQVYQLLMFSALRLNEAARASWTEFPPAVVRALRQREAGERIDWTNASNEPLAWIIPAERMKGKDEDAKPHLVPLTPDILQILETLPLFKRGDYLFSTSAGAKPVWIADRIKKKIDARMLRTLKAMARRRGDDPAMVELARWVNHDIRRSGRSNLSRLPIAEEVREAVLAHARPGIKGTYDVYDYADEKREALELWAARLRSIVEPPPTPDNVVQLQRAR
jgi:hypothetical protein